MDIKTDNIDNIKALMANILDGHNGENLYAYLAKFNSLNVGYVANAKSAREAVPEIFRKNGLYITYYINNKPTTEIFIGDKTVAGNEIEWVKDEYWEFSDGIGHVDSNSITLNQLSKEVLDLICANNEINIVNYPDGEDLTEFDVCGGNSKRAVNALRFADKEYNPANFSGLGRVYLRKNIVDDKNILTQEMINENNTRYIIQYAYDLNGATINIPTNSVLEFQGGSFTNGTLNCDGTVIMTYDKDWLDVTLSGTYFFFGWADSIEQVEIVNNLTTDDATKALSAAQGVVIKKLLDDASKALIDAQTEINQKFTQIAEQIQNITADIDIPTDKPAKPGLGDLWFNTTNKTLNYWNGTEWIELNDSFDSQKVSADVTDVQTVEANEEAEATAKIVNSQIQFTFKIPKGATGNTGPQGETGPRGEIGPEGPQGPPGNDGHDGEDGKDGVSPTLPNYSIYRYRKSDSKPATPTGTSQNPSGWTDIPNDAGNWWQCVGEVNGATGAVTRWGEVLPLNGRDGTAQDGKYTEMRFAVNASRVTYPTIDRSVRTPSGWTLAAPSVSQGQYLWMTTAIINPNDTLNTNWNIPVCISGPTGAEGATGPAGDPGSPGSQGPAGIPGVDMLVMYCVGTDTHIGGTTEVTDNWKSSDVYVITDPSHQGLGTGWYETIPDYDPSTQYIWCTQGKREYTSSTKYTETWNKPFRLNGLNGLNGEDGSGKRGQIVYPAGIYDNNTAYVTDENKAPYVLDTTDGYYYVLNAIMTWRGSEQGNRTPSQDYAINSGKYWLKFEGFNAIYAKIGIIANGLVGSAVFNGDWMFSQAGQNSSGGPSTQYENFNPSNPYGGAFRPNVAINLKTGEVYFGCDKTRFGADGSGKLANGNIKWDADGNVIYNGLLASLNVLEDTNSGVTYVDITLPHLSAPDADSEYQMEYTYVFGPKTRAGLTRRIQLQQRNDTLYYNGGTFTGSGVLNIEDKIPSAYGFIKFICRIDGQDNAWYMVVVKDCNP